MGSEKMTAFVDEKDSWVVLVLEKNVDEGDSKVKFINPKDLQNHIFVPRKIIFPLLEMNLLLKLLAFPKQQP